MLGKATAASTATREFWHGSLASLRRRYSRSFQDSLPGGPAVFYSRVQQSFPARVSRRFGSPNGVSKGSPGSVAPIRDRPCRHRPECAVRFHCPGPPDCTRTSLARPRQTAATHAHCRPSVPVPQLTRFCGFRALSGKPIPSVAICPQAPLQPDTQRSILIRKAIPVSAQSGESRVFHNLDRLRIKVPILELTVQNLADT